MIRFISVSDCDFGFRECIEAKDFENASSYYESLKYHYKKRGKEIEKLRECYRKQIDKEQLQISKLQDEIKNNEEIIFDMLNQCCGSDNNDLIDNHCMSCYEEASEYLTKKEILKEINKRMYKIMKKG